MLRVVLDTNVLISAILTDGKPRTLLRKGISKEFRIITSDLILQELGTVLRRPKFKTDEDEIHRIILALMQAAEVVEVVSKFNLVEEDPKDDMVVETAFDGKADFVVSGDSHLLALKSFRGIKIVSVNQMLANLEKVNETHN
jgi:putative PIN family toxin of toxin-antitoxin system